MNELRPYFEQLHRLYDKTSGLDHPLMLAYEKFLCNLYNVIVYGNEEFDPVELNHTECSILMDALIHAYNMFYQFASPEKMRWELTENDYVARFQRTRPGLFRFLIDELTTKGFDQRDKIFYRKRQTINESVWKNAEMINKGKSEKELLTSRDPKYRFKKYEEFRRNSSVKNNEENYENYKEWLRSEYPDIDIERAAGKNYHSFDNAYLGWFDRQRKNKS